MNSKSLALALLTPVAAMSLAGCGINSVPTAEENAKAKWGDVEASYQKRSDLIPNLEAAVKGNAKLEKDILVGVTEARAKATSVQVNTNANDLTDPAKVQAFENAQNELSSSIGRLLVSVENYPQITSSDTYRAFIRENSSVEQEINVARGDYNRAVQNYNTTIRTFPDAIGAKIFYGAKSMEPFKATAGAENAPKVTF